MSERFLWARYIEGPGETILAPAPPPGRRWTVERVFLDDDAVQLSVFLLPEERAATEERGE